MKREKIQHLTQENVLKAIARIKEEGVPSARESNTYDLVYEGVAYPPKYIISLAGYFSEKGQFILANTFAGGEESGGFAKLRELGFDILSKVETKDLPTPKEADRKMHYKYSYHAIDERLDEALFKEHFIEYVRYCRESSWFSVAEAYKFRFGRWISENVNLDTQSDEQVLAKCNESQEQAYDAEGKAKGVNFIVSQKRYQDEFISLVDIQNIRRLKNGELLNDYDLRESPLSFPKFSVWAGVLLPESNMIFGSDSLTYGIAHLFKLDDYPKSGVRAFNLANACLREIKILTERIYKDEAQELIQQVFPGANMDPVDWVWLVQDFILFLNRRVLSTAKNYFWVFQGDNYQVEKENGIVAAPVDKIHHHKRLREMREGDVVIHYTNSAIRALSTVVKEFVIAEKPYLRDKSENLIVEVDYNELSQPISAREIAKKFKDQKDLLPAKYSPLTKDLSANQVYMAAFNEASYRVLFNECNYWVFQGNPKIFDFETALLNEILTDWTVSAHKDKIKIGDKVMLWITGPQSGCYALAEVTSEPHKKTPSPDDDLWLEEDESELKAGIKITHNLVDNPILNDTVKSIKKLSKLNVGHQGTNFTATKEQYESILSLIDNKSFFYKTKSKFDHSIFENYIQFLRQINADLNLQPCDQRVVYSVRDGRLNFTVGQRYSFNLYLNHTKGIYGVISKDQLHESSEAYDGPSPQPFYTFYNEFSPQKSEWNSTIEAIKNELKRTTKSGFIRHNNTDFENFVFQIDSVRTSSTKENMNFPLNQILYGPPGTGKTYNTVNYALSIIENKPVASIQQEEREDVLRRYKSYIESGNIQFSTFHQSMSYEDFIEGIKPNLSESDSDEKSSLEYEIKSGILKSIVEKINDSKSLGQAVQSGVSIDLDLLNQPINKVSLGNSLAAEDDEIFQYCIENNCIAVGFGEEIDFSGVKTRLDIRNKYKEHGIEISHSMDFNISAIERLVLWMKPGQLVFISNGNRKLKAIAVIDGDYYIDTESPIRYKQFRKVKWLYTDLDIPIKEIYGKYFSQQTIYQMSHEYIDKDFFSAEMNEITNDKPYVLIIDEINRGNVSQIFGELITLLEEDKRDGNAEALSVVLPYSRERFTIPNNLYLLGTMNTADRSVESLDTALRRRFSFEEMMPKPELLKNEIMGVKLSDVLEKINERVELLVDRDHTIGHSYLMKVETPEDLASAFNDKVVPLLQEYFYGDYGKIGLVLGKGFVEKVKNKNKAFATFEYDGQRDFITDSFQLNQVNKDTVIKAVQELLNSNEE